MIDRNPYENQLQPTQPGSAAGEIFSDLFDKEKSSPQRNTGQLPKVKHSRAPNSPRSLADSGLTLMQVCELVLKQLYLHGGLVGVDIARHIRLPFQVVDEAVRFLKDGKIVEVTSGDVIGTASYRFSLTEIGRSRAKESFEQCRYVGPAPVSLEDYVAQCKRQSVAEIKCTNETLNAVFEHLIISDELIQELGPAVCSGLSVFIYGPPGNGKTMIAKGLGSFLNQHGGEVYVPYAIQAENGIITVFDPSLHQTTDDAELAQLDRLTSNGEDYLSDSPDLRWRRVRRPVVVTGGELTLEMLDLRYNPTSRFYTAPLHIKANGGVFLIDDFGRQIVSPRDLLNRWIMPLEERVDYLTLATGKKLSIPFEQLIIFSTNLDPSDLVDEAFLRRIRHKIRIDSPTRNHFTQIFELACKSRKIPFNPAAIDFLFDSYYSPESPPRSSDPRDLLEIVQSICRFRNQPVVLTPDLMAEATKRFFCKL